VKESSRRWLVAQLPPAVDGVEQVVNADEEEPVSRLAGTYLPPTMVCVQREPMTLPPPPDAVGEPVMVVVLVGEQR